MSPLQHVGHRWPGLDIVVPAQLSQRGCRHRYSQIGLEDLRVVSNLLWAPGRNNPAKIENGDSVAVAHDKFHVMLDETHRYSRLGYGAQPPPTPGTGDLQWPRWMSAARS